MMYNKMNVFHWHISDADSFPLQLQSYPNITTYGVFSEDEVYNLTDVNNIVTYALKRGIRY